GIDPVPSGPALAGAETEHLPAAAGDRRGDPAGRARRRDNGQFVHRFEQVRMGRHQRLLHREPPGEPEREFGAVDAVIAAVDQGHGAVDDLESERALLHRFADAVLDRRGPLPGNGAAVDFLLEDEALAAAERTDLDDHVAELAMAAGLLLVAAVLAHRLA